MISSGEHRCEDATICLAAETGPAPLLSWEHETDGEVMISNRRRFSTLIDSGWKELSDRSYLGWKNNDK
jgi:hypothetical protein